MDAPSKDTLIEALQAAGLAHHDYEANDLNGERDEQWPDWYAAYVIDRIGKFVPVGKLSNWLAEAPFSDNWAETAAMYVEIQLKSA